jgi:putative ABC transport system substrate-binding protein
VRRRNFIALLGGVTWPLFSRVQALEGVKRIGALISGAENDPEYQVRVAAFREGLEKLGWSERKNIRIDYRFTASSKERAEFLAKELVAAQPDVLFASSTLPATALQRETSTIPIVFGIVSDPIGSGFVASLARPGGNLTGFMLLESSVTGKWLGMLKEIAPHVTRAGFLANPKTMPYDYFLGAATKLAAPLSIDIVPIRIETAADIEREIDSFARNPNGALLLPADATTVVHRNLIVALAAQHQLPAVYADRAMVVAGGLMSYSADLVDLYRKSASYVDRILRGGKPADLPVQGPTSYQTVLNVKAARGLGLTIPAGLLVAADEVIE